MSESTSIFFVDDDRVVRTCLKSLLSKVNDFQVVGEAADGQSALEALKSLKPSVALIDIGLPGLDGIEVAREVKTSQPDCRVLMLTSSDDENDIFDSLDAGADGYVLKGDFSNNLEVAIRSVRIGAVWLDPAIARFVLKSRNSQRAGGGRKNRQRLSREEETILGKVADSNCKDGVCLVDPEFLKKLRRFSSTESGS